MLQARGIVLTISSCINAFVVKWYGEAEFWLALGKVFLILIVYSFTFITMVGGNPKKDAYGVCTCLSFLSDNR
jgi:amino acid transporter